MFKLKNEKLSPWAINWLTIKLIQIKLRTLFLILYKSEYD